MFFQLTISCQTQAPVSDGQDVDWKNPEQDGSMARDNGSEIHLGVSHAAAIKNGD